MRDRNRPIEPAPGAFSPRRILLLVALALVGLALLRGEVTSYAQADSVRASSSNGNSTTEIPRPAPAASFKIYKVNLSGAAESPPNASLGTGSGSIQVDTSLQTMRVTFSFSGLTGTTTASHIHCCTTAPLTGTAIVATTTPTFPSFPLGVTSGSYDHTFDMTLVSSYSSTFITANGGTAASAFAALIAGMDADKSYLNVNTTVFPGGEIRGFLIPLKLYLPLIMR